MTLLQKHMDQWRQLQFIKGVFLSELSIASNFYKWWIGLDIDDISIKYEFLDRTINIRGFIIFGSKFVSLMDMKNLTYFKKHCIAIEHLANNMNLMESTNPGIGKLQKYLMTRLLPIFSNT